MLGELKIFSILMKIYFLHNKQFVKKIIFSYQHGFLYIRQLSIHLRKGLMNVSRETLKSIANWQFVFAVTLWCKMLTVIEELEDLELPLVQAWIFRKF